MGKLQTNEELVQDLMQFSPFGAMGQVFIMQAIQTYAAQVLAAPAESLNMGDFMSGESWQAVARDVKTRCDTFYGRHEAATTQES